MTAAAARLAVAGLVRQPTKTAVRVVVLAAAVALLGSMILFIGHSLRTMTATAVRSVPLDLQGPVGSYPQARQLARGIGRQAGVAQASATATAPFAGASHRGAGGVASAGNGSLLAVPPGYLSHIRTFHLLQGKLKPGNVVLDQQLAATLRARIGDSVTITPRKGAHPQAFRVSGVAVVTAPDVLFAPLNPLLGPAPAQPPADVALMPTATFARSLGRDLPSIGTASTGASAVPGAQAGVQWQVQAQVDPAYLTGSPSHAFNLANQIRNRLERTFPGKVQFVDNLSDSLNTAAQDALYADALFIMLAVPGAMVALGLAYMAALGTADRDRRELALFRARGASRRDVAAMVGLESVAVGLIAGLLGAGVALASVAAIVKGSIGLTPLRAAIAVAACVALATAGAAAARSAAAFAALRSTVQEGRRSVQRERPPLWQRLYLDLIALALSGLIYWLTARTGFSAVVNPDSNPTLSLSVYMFFAPALLWLGATLLLVRVRGRALAWIAARVGSGRVGTGRVGFLLASAGRRGAAINRGLVTVGLLLAFGVSLGIFAATYDQQANVDAQLTLGADVTATAPAGVAKTRDLAKRIAAVPGVTATTALDHSYAYVGPDLQDTYGIDPGSITRATGLRDSYFKGGTSAQMLQRLRSTPDGILVAQETITDYSLRPGDLLKLRVLDHRTGRFRVVRFHVIGTVLEFPSAPKDSFMVANLDYLQKADHGGGPNVVFAKAPGDPKAVAHRVAQATRRDGVAVKDIREQTAQTVTSITTVDLRGISRIEEAFTIVLAAAAMWLFVTLGVSERRRELATMAAIGAPLRIVRGFVQSEAGLVAVAGLVLAAGLGLLLSEMLVAMLRHVFDPPPDHLAVPWRFLAGLAAAAIAGMVVALLVASRALRRLPLGEVLREQ
jgi:putative ABC transport system permease protein